MPKDNCTVARGGPRVTALSTSPCWGHKTGQSSRACFHCNRGYFATKVADRSRRPFLPYRQQERLLGAKASAATGQHLLLDAIRIAEKWVRAAC